MKIHLRKRPSTSLNPQVRRLVVSSPARANATFWRRNLLCLAGVIFVLAASVGLGWSRWLAVKDIPPLPPARRIERWQNSAWDGSVPIVKEYFLRTAHDPDAMEFPEWSPVYTSPTGLHEVRVAVRGKNMVGAKILKQYLVKYNEQAVLSTSPYPL